VETKAPVKLAEFFKKDLFFKIFLSYLYMSQS